MSPPEQHDRAFQALLEGRGGKVRELGQAGLRVAAFRVCNGRELFEVGLDVLVEVGAVLLLVAAWPP